ncbi:MAG TPA: PEPxxWA-CTERM sorting domain-containing protein [Rhizomicrobium sp.]|jgi:hypothetical protein
MLYGRMSLLIAALLLAVGGSAQAEIFATGAAVGGTQPDSITSGDGSIWVEYGNGADSTGASGNSTIVQYSPEGTVQQIYTIQGLADGLKFNPVTGMIWALQNNDGNATLSFIDPTTHAVFSPLTYGPPYSYGPNGGTGRGYDDVAFLNGQVYLSYTNPANPTDPVLQILNQGNNPTGSLTTTTILTAQQTGLTSSTNEPDIDSLKSTPNGNLVLTTEGDGPGCCDPVGEFTLISHPGTPGQTVTNVAVTSGGNNVSGIDDVIFPGATSGWLYVTETGANTVDKVWLSGLDPNTPIVAIGGLGEVALVDPTTGDVESALLSGLDSPHGMDFVPVPEPSTWAMMLIGFGGLGAALRLARRTNKKRQLALPMG